MPSKLVLWGHHQQEQRLYAHWMWTVLFSQVSSSFHTTCVCGPLLYSCAQPPKNPVTLHQELGLFSFHFWCHLSSQSSRWMLVPSHYLLSRVWFAIAESWQSVLSRISYGMSSEGLSLHVLRWKVFLESSKHALD